MKQVISYILLVFFLVAFNSCKHKDEINGNEDEIEFSLQFNVESYANATTKSTYQSTIKHLRILAFDAVSEVLLKQIVIPEGANPPTLLRLPWNKYTLVFLGNFTDINVEENSTTLNSLLVSMNVNPAYPGEGIYNTPLTPYFYYKVEKVQFGIVSNIPVTLRPVTSQLIFNYINKPAYYNAFSSDLKNVGLSLSMLGESLAPSVKVRKAISNLNSAQSLVSDTLYSFASIGTAYLKLSATDNVNHIDTLGYNYSYPIQPGNSYIIDFIFPNPPELNSVSVDEKRSPDKVDLKNIKILMRENK